MNDYLGRRPKNQTGSIVGSNAFGLDYCIRAFVPLFSMAAVRKTTVLTASSAAVHSDRSKDPLNADLYMANSIADGVIPKLIAVRFEQ